MARKDHRRLFEELGLLGEDEGTESVNPYKALGLDPEFVGELLREDPSGETIRYASTALRKVLARRYHPDVPKTGDAERFRRITEADSRIEEAWQNQETGTLARWARTEQGGGGSSYRQIKKAEAQRELLVSHAADMFQTNLELGNHPQHFSQLQWAQGALLQRATTPLLLQQLPDGGVRIARGDYLTIGSGTDESQAFDFPAFLQQHKLFGLKPGDPIVAYIDQEHRASILAPDLSFMMDVTVPVEEHRKKRRRTQGDSHDSVFWARSRSPTLFMTSVPMASGSHIPTTQIVTFTDIKDTGRNAAWELPMEVVGTISNQDFFNRIRYTRAAGAAGLAGSKQYAMQHFNLTATPARKFIEDDPGYSPVLTNGSSLVLYDAASDMPVITDAKVVGMIGSDSRAA